MAAIARDDEADIRECCKCRALSLLAICSFLASRIYRDPNELPSPCSKLWRNKRPPKMQSMPERLVLLCEVPEGQQAHTAHLNLMLWAVPILNGRDVSTIAYLAELDLTSVPECRLTGHSTKRSAIATSLQTLHKPQSQNLRAG